MDINIDGNNVKITAENLKLNNSLGFLLFQDKKNIKAEIDRVEKDIELLSFTQTIDLKTLLDALNSNSSGNSRANLISKLECTNEQAEFLLNIEISSFSKDFQSRLLVRLKEYKSFLEKL